MSESSKLNKLNRTAERITKGAASLLLASAALYGCGAGEKESAPKEQAQTQQEAPNQQNQAEQAPANLDEPAFTVGKIDGKIPEVGDNSLMINGKELLGIKGQSNVTEYTDEYGNKYTIVKEITPLNGKSCEEIAVERTTADGMTSREHVEDSQHCEPIEVNTTESPSVEPSPTVEAPTEAGAARLPEPSPSESPETLTGTYTDEDARNFGIELQNLTSVNKFVDENTVSTIEEAIQQAKKTDKKSDKAIARNEIDAPLSSLAEEISKMIADDMRRQIEATGNVNGSNLPGYIAFIIEKIQTGQPEGSDIQIVEEIVKRVVTVNYDLLMNTLGKGQDLNSPEYCNIQGGGNARIKIITSPKHKPGEIDITSYKIQKNNDETTISFPGKLTPVFSTPNGENFEHPLTCSDEEILKKYAKDMRPLEGEYSYKIKKIDGGLEVVDTKVG